MASWIILDRDEQNQITGNWARRRSLLFEHIEELTQQHNGKRWLVPYIWILAEVKESNWSLFNNWNVQYRKQPLLWNWSRGIQHATWIPPQSEMKWWRQFGNWLQTTKSDCKRESLCQMSGSKFELLSCYRLKVRLSLSRSDMLKADGNERRCEFVKILEDVIDDSKHFILTRTALVLTEGPCELNAGRQNIREKNADWPQSAPSIRMLNGTEPITYQNLEHVRWPDDH